MADTDTPTPVATAKDLRARTLRVSVPDSDLVMLCRRPDPLALVANGLVSLELLSTVVERIGQPQATVQAMVADPRAWSEFIDRWVCAAVVSPEVVFNLDDADDTRIWIEDLEPALRLAIWSRTNDRLVTSRVSQAVKSFRDGQSVDVGGGQSSEAVSQEPVGVAAGV